MTTTRVAEIRVEEDGAPYPIVSVRIKPGLEQGLDDARATVEACISEVGGRRCSLLIDISRAEIISADVRHFYSGGTLTEWFHAIALVIESSPMGRVMGNLYLRIARPGVPTQLFHDEAAAMAWLRRSGQ